MDANISLNPTFDWGDIVQVKVKASPNYKPGELGSIVGKRKVKKTLKSNLEEYEYWYLVEFGNGDAIEIPEIHLIKNSET